MTRPGDPVLVVLAAGASLRLGTCKALVTLGDHARSTPLSRLLAAGVSLATAPPLVVAGVDARAIRAAVPADVEVLENSLWHAGRTGSIQRATEARPDHDLCLAPVDVPLVPMRVFAALQTAWEVAGSPAEGWLAPCLAGTSPRRFGHPIVIGRTLLRELATWPPDRPLRDLRASAAPLLSVTVADPEILDDLDAPADLERLRRHLAP